MSGILRILTLVVFISAPSLAAAEPSITGEWTGTWGVYSPQMTLDMQKAAESARQRMQCSVTRLEDGAWQAVFTGKAGEAYTYTIRMNGRSSGGVVLFKGTVDLGKKDGGVYDWIGRATETDFIGFYTSSTYTGTFHLKRPQR